MPSEEFKRLQEALRGSPTPEARKQAADAMRKYLSASTSAGNRVMISSGNSIPVNEIPDQLEKDPAFFERFGKQVNRST